MCSFQHPAAAAVAATGAAVENTKISKQQMQAFGGKPKGGGFQQRTKVTGHAGLPRLRTATEKVGVAHFLS